MPALAKSNRPHASALKDQYRIGEIPPLGHVPAQMHAWAIRKDRHGPPESSMQLEVLPTWPIGEDEDGWEEIVVGIDSIIIMLIVGAIAGWLAGNIVRGFGYGLIWNIIIGIVGAFIGVWLLTRLGFVPFVGFVGSIVNAVIGAVILLVIVGFIRR